MNKDTPEYIKVEKMMLLAARIDGALKDSGMSKKEFALAINSKPSVISKYLSGTHNFTVNTLMDIERVLNITIIQTSMEKQTKVRISCGNCLHSKIMPKHESDPQNTRFIITESCDKCCAESSGNIRYYNLDGDELDHGK